MVTVVPAVQLASAISGHKRSSRIRWTPSRLRLISHRKSPASSTLEGSWRLCRRNSSSALVRRLGM